MNQSVRMIGGPLLLVAALIVARLLFPTKMNFITEISIFSIYVMGCNVLYGYLGMVSFGQLFYLSVCAYVSALYLVYFELFSAIYHDIYYMSLNFSISFHHIYINFAA